MTISDVKGDTTKKQVSSTIVVSGIIVVATFDGSSIDSDPIDFLFYVADKPALEAEIKNKLDADGATANLNYIDTSDITDMSLLFEANRTFNGDISKWDTSSVINMRGMFFAATAFNGDISKWDVSNVENMETMFNGATAFNQDLTAWVDKSGRNSTRMFSRANAMQPENKPSWAR